MLEVEGHRVSFDHDYAAEVAAKRQRYAVNKKNLKERGIRFQSPRDTLRVHWTEGVKVYNGAQDAARAMRERGRQVPDPGGERQTPLRRLEAAPKWTKIRR